MPARGITDNEAFKHHSREVPTARLCASLCFHTINDTHNINNNSNNINMEGQLKSVMIQCQVM
jgi:hypothetical protein